MGIPTSEVGYTSATTGRETTKFMTDMWWHWKTTTKTTTTLMNNYSKNAGNLILLLIKPPFLQYTVNAVIV
jgi:low temperature requirement protein LtrA